MTAAEIAELEDRRFAAMFAADAQTLDELFAADLHYCHSSGVVDSKAQFLANMASGDVRYMAGERSETEVRVDDSTAIVTGRARLDVAVRDQPIELTLRYLAIWTRVDGTWRFRAWQSTPAK